MENVETEAAPVPAPMPATVVEPAAEPVAERADLYTCPGCNAGGIAPILCPACAAACPPNYCQHCGYPLGVQACPACAQPLPGRVAAEKVEGLSKMFASPAAADAFALRAASFAPLADFVIRAEPLEGVLEAYASADVYDSHGTLISQCEIARLLPDAAVDQNHDFSRIEGVRVVSVEPVKRQIDGKETDSVKTVLRFDLAVDAARRAFDAVRAGVYKGLSIAFSMPSDLAAAVANGATKIIDRIKALPFISLVTDPSNGAALIDCYRSKLEDEDFARAGAPMAALIERAKTERREQETRHRSEIASLRDEQSAKVDRAVADLKTRVLDLVNTKVAPALAVQEEQIKALSLRVKQLAADLDRLTVRPAPKARTTAPDPETEPITEPKTEARRPARWDW